MSRVAPESPCAPNRSCDPRKGADIEEIARREAVEKSTELARTQFLEPDDGDRRALQITGLPKRGADESMQGKAEEEVEVDLDAVGRALRAGVAEEELAPRVLAVRTLHAVPLTRGDRLDGALDLRTVLDHPGAVHARDVVEVEIDRQTPGFPEAEIQRTAALEREGGRQ